MEKQEADERNVMERDLAQRRILLLQGSINEKKVNYLRGELTALNLQSEQEVKLVIDSSGGEIDTALWLFDFLGFSRVPVIGIVNGRCHSAAILVLQGCTKRLATKHSSFLIHQISRTFTVSHKDNLESKVQDQVERPQADSKICRGSTSSEDGENICRCEANDA